MLAPLDLVYVCGNRVPRHQRDQGRRPADLPRRGYPGERIGSLPEGAYEEPGYSETEIETSNRGVVELYRGEERVARRRNEGLPCGAPAISASAAAMGDPVAGGEWSSPFPWPVVAIHMSLLPDGRVLSWGASGTSQVWDPASGSSGASLPSRRILLGAHASCRMAACWWRAGTSATGTGCLTSVCSTPARTAGPRRARCAAAAGTPPSRPWARATRSSSPAGIRPASSSPSRRSGRPETCKVLTGASRTLPYYPRSSSPRTAGCSTPASSRRARYLNPSGAGSWTNVGDRRYGLRDYGAAVMYDRGKILYAGGGPNDEHGGNRSISPPEPPSGSGPGRWPSRAAI